MRKSLYVHYMGGLIDSELDERIKTVCETFGGKWYGSGMAICDGDRDSSFDFKSNEDLEKALKTLGDEFQLTYLPEKLRTADAQEKPVHWQLARRPDAASNRL